MPITDSAKKALRQNKRRHTKNVAMKRAFKTVIKEVRQLISIKNIEEAKKKLAVVYKKLDKAAKSGVIKKNTASRLKSRIARRLKS